MLGLGEDPHKESQELLQCSPSLGGNELQEQLASGSIEAGEDLPKTQIPFYSRDREDRGTESLFSKAFAGTDTLDMDRPLGM